MTTTDSTLAPDTLNLTTAQRFRIMRAAFFTPSVASGHRKVTWGLPLMFWGDPGVAKTSAMRQLADAVGAKIEVFSPGERGEGAIGAVPVPSQDGYIDHPPPAWSRQFIQDGGYGLLFLDELPTADPRVQPAMMAAMFERSIGGASLGGRVRAWAAGNPVDQTPGGTDLSLPMANRLVHIQWAKPTVDEWIAFMSTATAAELSHDESSGGPVRVADPFAMEAEVLAAWPTAYAYALSQVGSFLKARGDLLHKLPDQGSSGHGKAWPSPRSWDLAVRSLAAAAIHRLDDDETLALVAGCVGAASAREFLVFKAKMDLPNPEDILSGKITWKSIGVRLDIQRAVLTGVTTLACSLPKNDKRRYDYAARFWALLADIVQTAPDMVVPAAAAAAPAGLVTEGAVKGAAFTDSNNMKVMRAISSAGVGQNSAR